MAAIVKKKLKKGIKYYVVYSFIDSKGKRKQKWEPYEKHQDALKRKGEIEFKSAEREYIKPNCMTVKEFMELFVSNYGMERWAFSTYDSNVGIIRHYVNPTLGDVKIQEVTPLFITSYYQRLAKVKAVPHRTGEATGKCLSKTQIRGIHKLLRCAFGFAAEMELIADNPFAKIKAPRASYKKREAWTPDTIQRALNLCKDNRLFMAINLAFACSMRIGEVLGLTWDNIHISSDDLEQGNAHLFIEKELQRASLESIQKLKSEDIFYIFEPFKKNNVTRLLLKTPKTESSVRRVWIPETLAGMLISWRESQERLEEFLGDEYRRYAGGDGREYKFVIALNDGSPCEERIITKAFEKLITKNELPRVVFHSLRKSSATYKLKESGGDIKSVQGDGGWAEPDMVTKTYSEIIDEDRKVNAHRFNKSFYSGFVVNNVAPTSRPLLISDGNKVAEPMSQNEVLELLELFQQSPELLKVLELVQSQPDIAKILLTLSNTKKHLDL